MNFNIIPQPLQNILRLNLQFVRILCMTFHIHRCIDSLLLNQLMQGNGNQLFLWKLSFQNHVQLLVYVNPSAVGNHSSYHICYKGKRQSSPTAVFWSLYNKMLYSRIITPPTNTLKLRTFLASCYQYVTKYRYVINLKFILQEKLSQITLMATYMQKKLYEIHHYQQRLNIVGHKSYWDRLLIIYYNCLPSQFMCLMHIIHM